MNNFEKRKYLYQNRLHIRRLIDSGKTFIEVAKLYNAGADQISAHYKNDLPPHDYKKQEKSKLVKDDIAYLQRMNANFA